MQGKRVTIFGGSGFVGRTLVQKLAALGAVIRVGVRHPEKALFLKPMGDVGQITPLKVNVLNLKEVENLCEGADIVINLIGILYEKRRWTFEAVHVEAAQNIAKAAKKAGVKRLLHMSALGADLKSASKYAQTKAKGEQAVLKAFPTVTLFRPSVIFGPDDAFLNRFATMALLSPVLPSFGKGETKFQPVYVGDVADAFLAALEDSRSLGTTYELTGPDTFTFDEIMEVVQEYTKRKKFLLHLPYSLGKLIGCLLEWLPTPPLTRDQVFLLEKDNIKDKHSKGFKELGLVPTPIRAIAPGYLERFQPHF